MLVSVSTDTHFYLDLKNWSTWCNGTAPENRNSVSKRKIFRLKEMQKKKLHLLRINSGSKHGWFTLGVAAEAIRPGSDVVQMPIRLGHRYDRLDTR